MTHRSATIECDPRETEIIKSATSFLAVVKLGRGKEDRRRYPFFRICQLNCEAIHEETGKGIVVYACGTAGGLEATALYATLTPMGREESFGKRTFRWKFAEAAPEATQAQGESK